MSEFSYIEKHIQLLNQNIYKMNEYLLYNDKYNHSIVEDQLFKLNKILMKTKLMLNDIHIKYKNNDKIQEKINFYETRTKFFSDSIEVIDKYNNSINLKGQHKSLKVLTTINMIALPLAIITGYFGMNFKSMGNPTSNNGILSHLHGQKIVLILFIISIITMIILTRFFVT